MLWWLGCKAKNLIWKGASKLELNGNLNPAKLEAVQKQLIEEGATLPGKATPEDVGKWMLERGFKWSKGDLITQLNTHAQKSKAMVDELLWLSTSTHKVEEVNQALEMLAKDYSTIPGLTKKADEILGLMKDEYTLSEMNQVKRYMDEAYNMFKQNGWEVAGLKAEGLRTIRKEIKTTIENVAEQEGLWNIRMLNNETQVARGLAEGIAKKEDAATVREILSPFSSARNGAILGGIGGASDPRDSFPERLLKMAWGAVVGGLIGSTQVKTTVANMLKKLWGVERKELEQWVATEGKSQLSQWASDFLWKIANTTRKIWEDAQKSVIPHEVDENWVKYIVNSKGQKVFNKKPDNLANRKWNKQQFTNTYEYPLQENSKKYLSNLDDLIEQKVDSAELARITWKAYKDGKERPLILTEGILWHTFASHWAFSKKNLLETANNPNYIIVNYWNVEGQINLIKKLPNTSDFLIIWAKRQNGSFMTTHFQKITGNKNALENYLKKWESVITLEK